MSEPDEGPYEAVDEAEAEVAPPAPVAMGEVRDANVIAEEAPRFHAGEGRRVRLVRDADGGGYSICLGSRVVQSFCGEWEDITRYPLPLGIEQQIRINIQPLGEAREAREVVQAREQRDNEIRQLEEAHAEVTQRFGGQADLSRLEERIAEVRANRADPDLIRMFQQLPEHQQEIISGQIRANFDQMVRMRDVNPLRPQPQPTVGAGQAGLVRPADPLQPVTREEFNGLVRSVDALVGWMNNQ